MLSLFQQKKLLYGGRINPFRLRDVHQRMVEDVGKVIQYYRTSGRVVKNDHILNVLINTINVPLRYDLMHYHDVVWQRGIHVARFLGMTSSLARGKWFNSTFYGNLDEIILAYNGSNNPNKLEKNWEDLEPVKVLECPVSDSSYQIPDGKEHSKAKGIVVIGIDIPMLMVMYRKFCEKEQIRRLNPDVAKYGTPNFIAMYVLPNMLKSQTDLMIVNRLINLFEGTANCKSLTKHPFFISDYTPLLDRNLELIIERFNELPLLYRNMILQIPYVFSEDALDIPDIAPTVQVNWALWLTRLKMIKFLTEVGNANTIELNRADLNDLRIELRNFRTNHVWGNVLPKDHRSLILQQLDTLEKV
jgi:hypothetical protein